MWEFHEVLNSTFEVLKHIPLDSEAIRKCQNGTIRGPTAVKFLRNLDYYQGVLLICATLLTMTVTGYAFVQCLMVQANVSKSKRRSKLYFLISLFPVSMSFCLVGMISPRAAALSTSCGLFYFLVVFYIYITLVMNLVRRNPNDSQLCGVKARLNERGKRINMRVPPICCLIPCMPEPKVTTQRIQIIKLLVLQGPLIRSFVFFFEVCLTIELGREANIIIQYCEMVALLSTFSVVFGSHTFTRLVVHEIQSYQVVTIIRAISLALFSFSAQYPLLFQNVFLRLNLIRCGPVLSIPESARFICNFMVICQLFVLNLYFNSALKPEKNDIFDLAEASDAVPSEEDLSNYKQSLLLSLLTPIRKKKNLRFV
ncbi:unnamed protein product [Bursaphelenchus xylophilus]|uniref:(pine wood nematode) hypothetical protein n=1 Tax=Bursaphelenchus xylophilus TaxID=6326 RepID=A0A1I7SRG5_BURXY|nr:unnamed protein product [Bursaphelenchus xylophilus]CAG9102432.1 unnamed protein product [Bursaphelenchus xylophilus]